MANKNQIQLPISQESARTHAKMAKEFAKAREETAEILSNFKALQDLMKTMKAQGFLTGGRGSVSDALAGQVARARRERERLAFDGTNRGGRVSSEKETTRQAREGLRYLQQQLVTSKALTLNARTRSQTLRQITSLQDAVNTKAAIEKRLGLEALNGKRSTVRAFQRQLGVLDQVIARLKREKQITDQIARANQRNAELERAQASRARRATRERLFGDNGATLLTVQAGLMANYAGISALQGGLQAAFDFTVQLDGALRNLQAIVGLADGSMEGLRDTIIEVSEATKFTAVEVAEAAVTLGQAGLSVREIEDSIKAVTLLATATGTDLPRAVDIATSVLGVFNMESARMASVADMMTEAVNSSKLNLEKLTLGLQYSGNIAAQSGVKFDELTAALGAMANAGIRSGSTLGTGTRQILIALQKPSEAFLRRLEEMGLTMDDLNIRTKGLYGVLKTLRDAGFSSTDAIEAFEVRAASAYNALSANLDQMLDLQSAFQDTTAATRANETQMRSFQNQSARLGSVLGSIASEALTPLVAGLTATMDVASTVLSTLIDFGPVLGVITTALGAMAAGWVAQKVVAVVSTLIAGATTRMHAHNVATLLGAVRSDAYTVAQLRQSRVLRANIILHNMTRASMVGVGVTLAILAASVLATAGNYARLNSRLDEARSAFEESEGDMESLEDQISAVSDKIQELIDKAETLANDPAQLRAMINEIKSKFEEMGLVGISTANTVQDLIDVLQNLREELRQEYRIRITMAEADLIPLQMLADQRANAARDQVTDYVRMWGRSQVQGPYTQDLTQLNLQDMGAIEEYMAEIIDRRRDLSTSTSTRDQVEAHVITEVVALLQELLGAMREQERLLETQQDLIEDRQDSLSQSNPYFRGAERIIEGIEVRAVALRQNVAALQNDSPTADLQAFQQGRVAMDRDLDAADRAIVQLIQRGLITNDVFDAARRDIEAQRDRINQMEEALQSLADAERSTDIDQDLGVIQGRLSGFAGSIEGQNTATVQQILQARTRDVVAARDMRLEQMRLDPNSSMTQAQMQREADLWADQAMETLQEAYLSWYNAQLEDQQENFRNAVEIQIEALERRATEISQELQEATTPLGAADALDSAEANLRRQSAMQLQLDLVGVTDPWARQVVQNRSQAELDEQLQAIREQYQEAMERIDQLEEGRVSQQRERQVASWERQLSQLQEEAEGGVSSQRMDAIEAEMLRLVNQLETAATQEALANTDLQTENWEAVSGAISDQYDAMRESVRESMAEIRETLPWLQGVEEALGNLTAPEIDVMSPSDAREEYGELAEAMIAVQEAQRDLARMAGREGLDTLLGEISDVTDELGLSAEEAQYFQDELEAIRGMTSFEDQATALSGLVTWLTTAITSLGVMKEEAVAIAEALMAAAGTATTLAGNDNPPPNRRGGGQSAAERTAEAFNRFFEELETTASMAQISLEQGLMDESGVLSSMEALVASATERAEAMRGEIDNLMSIEERSTAQQEMLNELVREYGQLHEFVRDRQEEIIELQIRSGQIQQGLNGLVSQWANENLNMASTLMSGVTNILGTARGAMTEFFTTLTDGTASGADAFRQLASSVIRSLQQMLAEMLSVYLMQQMLGWVGLGGGGKAGGLLGFLGLREGGQARQAAAGERVNGNLNRDSVNYKLMDGEYVLRRSAAQAIGYDELDKINAMGNNASAKADHHGAARPKADQGKSRPQNIYLVDDRSKVGNLGPDDILAVVGDDIARGGTTKTLIRAVQTGGI